MEKKPLYRKVSKTTHNGFSHADYGEKKRAKFSRHTKNGIDRSMGGIKHGEGSVTDYDYTPLFQFLLKQEGRDWDEVWKECKERLNKTEPVLYMVVNIYKNGLVNLRWRMPEDKEPVLDWKGRDLANAGEKSFGYGEGSRFSTMYVDEDNKLQFVDKNYVSGPDYEVERRWGETFNGRLYDTYKRPAKKTEKMKSYIKNNKKEDGRETKNKVA